MMSYAYQQYTLDDLPGEKWDDIPGFDGIYQISNYGRIKSLSREMPMNSPHGGFYRKKEMILRARLDAKMNKLIKDKIYSLVVTLHLDGIKYYYSVARLVYNVFVEPIDLDSLDYLITFRDGDGRNIHADNLIKSNISDIKLQSYNNGRAVSHLSGLSQPVTQFDAEGNVVRSYSSYYEAEKITGISGRNISEVVNGDHWMFKGYFWKAGIHRRSLELSALTHHNARPNINYPLARRLGWKKIDPKNVPAILNLSLESMIGERWKPMPDYEGLYEVSNYGRVKALAKVSSGKQQKFFPAQIQSITVNFPKHNTTGSTFAGTSKDGIKKAVSIPRLVYYLFVRKFDRSDTTQRIYYKDGNSLNVRFDNLELKHSAYSFLKNKKVVLK